MARRKNEADRFADELSNVLMNVPVWVGPGLAVAVFLGLRYLLPAVLPDSNELAAGMLGSISRMVAPFGALLIVVIWIGAEVKKVSRRKLLADQTNVDSLRELSWQDFEHLVAEAFRRQGYFIEEQGGRGPDGGVDLVLAKRGENVLVQCKRWRETKVGVAIVRELYGVMTAEKADRGIVVTCGHFTDDAKRFAAGKALELLDGPALWELVKTVKGEAAEPPDRATTVETEVPATPRAIPAPFPEASPVPSCPKCGGTMVLRTARRGPNAGSQFYGCTNYPNCRGTCPA